MKKSTLKHGKLVLIIAAGSIVPSIIATPNYTDADFVIKSICLLPNNEKLLVEEIANVTEALVTESKKTVDKMLDSLDKTPLSYFSNRMNFIIGRIGGISNTLDKHSKELSSDLPNEYSNSIKLSVDLLNIVTKYLKKVHAILINPKFNTKALKLAKQLEKSQTILEKSYAKCSKKLILLIENLETLGLDAQVDQLRELKDIIDAGYDELTNPTAASMAQNIKIVDALNAKIKAEQAKK